MTADRIFTNCRAYTLDAKSTVADAVAVGEGRIIGVGDVEGLTGPNTERIDLGGRTAVPGLIDSHAHLIDYGLAVTRSADLSGSTSIAEVLRRLRDFRSTNLDRPWLLGHRFDQELFDEGRWITRADLDQVSSAIPILISRVCLHAVVANSAALRAIEAKLSAEQLETGVLTEGAAGLIWEQVPSPSTQEREQAALWAFRDARRVGLAGVHCILDSEEDLQAVRFLHDRGELPIRLRVQCPPGLVTQLVAGGLRTGSGDDMLRVGSIKLFMDGSMGAHTAALRKPFADDPGNCGSLFMNEKDLAATLIDLQRQGFQAAIHAIGDLAVECTLKGIEAAAPHGNEGNRLRHRIEHASQMSPELISEMARLNVPAAVQPQFIITDFWTHERVGPERYRWCYPFKTMLEAGITLAMGSDCPVERLDPFELIHRAVNREQRSLRERLSVEETLRTYTLGSAYAGREESEKGSLEVGKLADFTVLSEDPFRADPSGLGRIRAEFVVIGGETG